MKIYVKPTYAKRLPKGAILKAHKKSTLNTLISVFKGFITGFKFAKILQICKFAKIMAMCVPTICILVMYLYYILNAK